MRLSRLTLNIAITILAALAALLVAWIASNAIETSAKAGIESQFRLEGIEWANVETNGLQIQLSGTAPDEAERFRAIAAVGAVVDSARVVDQTEVEAAAAITPPRFSVEILRNDRGISLIGLIPAATDREALAKRISTIADNASVTDLLESADHPMPQNWGAALDFALQALEKLPRSKISMAADWVAITAIASSAEEKRALEAMLARTAPGGLGLTVDISAPRPVITPFTLRFTKDEEGVRFDACSAHSPAGRDLINAAARKLGLEEKSNCIIGLGVPTPEWPQAVVAGIGAIGELGGGSVTFSDADITLVALDTTPAALFDRVIGELEAALPDVFSLHAVLPEPVAIDGTGERDDGPPEFIATLSPEGQVQLRGRLSDEIRRNVAESFARAHFGAGMVHDATRLDEDLPAAWSTRVLAGLEALSYLSNGVLVVQPDVVDIRGDTGNAAANSEISRILSQKLGEAQDFRVHVTYQEELDLVASKPSPAECVGKINAVLETAKITFAPGSADIIAEARVSVDKIAEIMKQCEDIAMEIGGFTDSQGREEMNRTLSQARAQAVLNALLARRVLTSNLTAFGYGEEKPIADNATEEGREANRRIEFRLILPAANPDEAAATEEGSEGGEAEAPTDGEQAEEQAGEQTGETNE